MKRGKEKQKSQRAEALEPGVDYVFEFDKIKKTPGARVVPPGKDVRDGEPPAAHAECRQEWVFFQRARPMAPDLENAPLPSQGITEEARAKRCSVYRGPWALSRKTATAGAPRLADLGTASAREESRSGDAPKGAPAASRTFRQGRQTYIRSFWPRGKRQVVSFSLARGAQGRGGATTTRGRTQGPAALCKLTASDAGSAVALSNDIGDGKNTVAEQVLRIVQRAVALAKSPSTQDVDAAKNLFSRAAP